MTSEELFVKMGDASYWLFEKVFEPMSDGDMIWRLVLIGGFGGFGYWMFRQYKFNKEAEADPNQLK